MACHRHVLSPAKTPLDFSKVQTELRIFESVISHKFNIDANALPSWKCVLINNDEPNVLVRVSFAGQCLIAVAFALSTGSSPDVFEVMQSLSSSIISTPALLFCGTFMDTYKFVFLGLTGLLLQDAATVYSGFTTMGLDFPAASGEPDSPIVIWLQACYFLFGLVMPLAMLLASFIALFVPMSIGRQKQALVLTEIFNAWSSIDVFCVAVVAGVLQLPLVRLLL